MIFPRMNATQFTTSWFVSFIPATVSVDSVQRFIRHNDLKSARYPNLLLTEKPLKKIPSVKSGRQIPVISHT